MPQMNNPFRHRFALGNVTVRGRTHIIVLEAFVEPGTRFDYITLE